jgi:hypothetical protein
MFGSGAGNINTLQQGELHHIMEHEKKMSRKEWEELKKELMRITSWSLATRIAMALFKGWVLSVLWNWFIPSTFTSVPRLSIGEAIGISLVLSWTIGFQQHQTEEEEGKIRITVFADAFHLFTKGVGLLFVGFILHFLMT